MIRDAIEARLGEPHDLMITEYWHVKDVRAECSCGWWLLCPGRDEARVEHQLHRRALAEAIGADHE